MKRTIRLLALGTLMVLASINLTGCDSTFDWSQISSYLNAFSSIVSGVSSLFSSGSTTSTSTTSTATGLDTWSSALGTLGGSNTSAGSTLVSGTDSDPFSTGSTLTGSGLTTNSTTWTSAEARYQDLANRLNAVASNIRANDTVKNEAVRLRTILDSLHQQVVVAQNASLLTGWQTETVAIENKLNNLNALTGI